MTYLLIRNKIIAGIDIETAGLWEGMNKISTFSMLVFTSLLTLYLLPKLAENKTICGYKSIMTDYFKFVLPLMIVLFAVVFLFRILIINLFLTESFLEIGNFFHLQLIGDFIKVVAFSLAYQFHAKQIIIPYFISDAILYGSFYLISVFLLDAYQLSGVYYAYISSLVLYLLVVIISIFFTRNKYLRANV
jgi:PST family polysaccharide transporter